MSSHTERYKVHPHRPRNVNRVHAESLTLNDRIALRVSALIGTMWFCYALAVLMIMWAFFQQLLLPWFHISAFDPFPYSFLFFCLGGIMQSLLMPMVMVEQNRQAHHTEQKSDEEFQMMEKVSHDQAIVIEQNNEIIQQNAEIIQQNNDQAKMLTALLTPPVTIRRKVRKQEVSQE